MYVTKIIQECEQIAENLHNGENLDHCDTFKKFLKGTIEHYLADHYKSWSIIPAYRWPYLLFTVMYDDFELDGAPYYMTFKYFEGEYMLESGCKVTLSLPLEKITEACEILKEVMNEELKHDV